MSTTLISIDGTSTDLVSVDELKTHLRIDGTTEDTYLAALLDSAVDYIEAETDKDFIQKTYDEIRPCFPHHREPLKLYKPPLKTVTSVKYYDGSNTLQTWDSTNYTVRTPTILTGYIVPAADVYYPITYIRDDAVTVRYTTSSTFKPAMLHHAIKLICGLYHENREAETPINLKPFMTAGVERLLQLLSHGGYFGSW